MHKPYKILLSAYACEPNRGSEPGVGWNWALEIAKRGHHVFVMTRENNKNAIDIYFKSHHKPTNLEFIYYDLPIWFLQYKKWLGVHLYYFLWQIGILKVVKREHKKNKFDFIHHITFVTIHQPSFLFLMKDIPFFYGPSGGGDLVPKNFLKSFPFKKRIKEYFLYLQNKLLIFDPLRRWMFTKSHLIFCNSKQTESFLPKSVHFKSYLNLAIGSSEVKDELTEIKDNNRVFRILYAGNLLHWKGLHLAIQAINQFKENYSLKFTIIGYGNILEFEKYVDKDQQIEFINNLPQPELFEKYKLYDVFLFPSFRDSGGMVVLEALSFGLPVICFDLGGPGQIVNETCGKVITTHNSTERELIQKIFNAINAFIEDTQELKQLKVGAKERAKELTWQKTVAKVYGKIETFMQNYTR